MKEKKLFKKYFLRFKNEELEEKYQNERRESSYMKFKRFNILISVSLSSMFVILYLVGQFRRGYRENQEDAACKLRTDYMVMLMLPIMVGSIQIDTIFMKLKILQWMRGTLTLLVFFIATTEISIDKFADMKSQSVEFGQITYLIMLTIYVGKEIIKYWERATITYLLGLLYFFARHLQLGKSVLAQVLIITPMHLLIMGFLYYNFELSERKLFYLHYMADKKEKEWSKLFGKMLVGLIIRNKRRKIIYSNKIGKQLVGCQEITTSTENEIIKKALEEIDMKWKNKELGGEKIDHDIFSNRENKKRYLEINKMSFELNNERCKVYIMKDITLAKQVQLDMMKNAEEKDIFFASMSHELRNPLNALLGSIDIFKKSNYEFDQEIIQIAETCGESLLNIIGNILDVSKIENQKLEISPSGGNIVESVIKVVLMMRGLAEKKGLYLTFESESDIHKYYYFDHIRLNQVLINILGNAIKFTDKGGIQVHLNYYPQEEIEDENLRTVNLEKIHLDNYETFIENVAYDVGNVTEGVEDRNMLRIPLDSPSTVDQLNMINSTRNYLIEERKANEEELAECTYEEEHKILEEESISTFNDQRGFIKIQIIDSGTGISQSDIGKLFNPFSQAGNSRKKLGGTGLGLWISDNIIKKMGGSLKLVSEENIGSSFVIVIPLDKYNYTQHMKNYINQSDVYHNSRILMVEDDDSNRKIMGELLERSGSSVYLANNGQTGLEIFKNMSEETVPNRYFTAILTDLRMPIMSGQNLIMSIRKYEKTSRLEETPIIVISGDPSENEKAKCLQVLGANKFLCKPVTLYMIETALIEILNAQTEHEETSEIMQQIVEERKLQILVVDDDIYCSHIFTRQLIDYNYPSFHAVYSGFEALNYFKTVMLKNLTHLSIIFLDSHLQDSTGPELATQFFALAADIDHDVKIFGVSGDTIADQQEFYSKASCPPLNDYFQKPINFPNLFNKLKHAVI